MPSAFASWCFLKLHHCDISSSDGVCVCAKHFWLVKHFEVLIFFPLEEHLGLKQMAV